VTALRDAIEKDARRLLEDTQYTPKGHYNTEALWHRWRFALGVPAAAVTALAGVVTAAGAPRWIPVLLATLGALLGAAATVLNPGEQARLSRIAADSHKEFHEKLRRWVELDLPRLDDVQARSEYEELAREKAKLNRGAPPIPRPAWRRTQEGVKAGEAEHFADRPTPPT
jgi:hypothetical protein